MNTHLSVGRLASLVLVSLAAASCGSSREDPSVGSTVAALSEEDAVRAACKGTYRNHGQCVACVAHASGDGSLVSAFAQGECHDACIRTSCAVEEKSCGSIPDGCGGALVCGPPCAAQPLFTAEENGATYRVREVCTGTRSDRVGTLGSCCRQDTYVTETLCTTTLHEVTGVDGKLTVVIDPLGGCATTGSDQSCVVSGDPARCAASGPRFTCPVSATASPGDPQGIAGTYVRALLQPFGVGPVVPLDEYRGGCSLSSAFVTPMPTCTPPSPQVAVAHMSTFTKTGPGAFALARVTGRAGSFSPATYCGSPITAFPTNTITPASTATGGFIPPPGPSGTFAFTGHDCAYELTRLP